MDFEELKLHVGRRIKHYREKKGLQQQALAAKIDYDKSNMSRLEAGKMNVTLLTLHTVARALDINIEDLLK
ncbi:helix-turn-helix domain-containing protein [Aureispira sp. CCB-QB1]|uniref:helix-turn-helix domain-containing protein n=1 Tax=Aureispira sp. CCB-QB1 TaxID=1313421 RepID=UPI0006974425|nr:helix-turn-helix transcriptional regulator [Aureispira sp. CCB-QB1]